NISTTIAIKGRLNFNLLQKTLNLLLASDVSLRTRFIIKEDEVWQYHSPFTEEQFAIFDFSQTSKQGIENWQQAITREVIHLLDGPLYRFILFKTGENSGGLLVKTHHIISDGWSQVLLCNKIGQTYLDLLHGKEPQLPDAPSYQLHVQAENDYLSSGAYKKDHDYWQQQLDQVGEASIIKSLQSASISPVGHRSSFVLPQTLNHAIYSFCVENRVAPFAVFYMALAIYFKRIGGGDRFTIGVPIFNRVNYTFKQTTGMFVSTLPFLNALDEQWSLNQFNENLSENWYELLRHQRFPFVHIDKMARDEYPGFGKLFNIALSYQDSKIFESPDAAVIFSGRWHYSGYQSEQLCIHLSNMLDHRCYAVDYDYLSQFFSEEEISDLHNCLVNILQEALSFPHKPICQLAVLGMEERETVLYGFNRSSKVFYEKSLYAKFAKVVRNHPQRAAVIFDNQRISYQKLDEQGASLAQAAYSLCAKKNALVAVLLPRSGSLFVALTGLMRLGYAHLLLSPQLPAHRIEEILNQSGADLLISRESIMDEISLNALAIPFLDIDKIEEHQEDHGQEFLSLKADSDDLAYVVYTSGSTGQPKGVEITQGNLLNLIADMRHIYSKGAVLSVCNIGFDAFILESIVPLLNGKTIVLPQDDQLEVPTKLAALIKGYGVGFLAITPSRLAAYLREPAFSSAMNGMESIVCGGENFSGELLQRLQLITHAHIYNQYGPSETTVGVSIKLLNNSQAITVGSPMNNCRMYVLDAWMNPLPIGVYGDLYIGGKCVGRGYRNAPDLTEASFLLNPFETGDMIYRTGDIACWNPQGEIVLAGRSDKQIKLRGLRIELQEISSCLSRYPGIRESVCCVFHIAGQEILAAYYTGDREFQQRELLSFLASYLP
ncbi:MAG: amino acid adenylation domain-containing protein, partial [Clostridiales bacterium]